MRVPRIPGALLKSRINTYRELTDSTNDIGEVVMRTDRILLNVRTHLQADDSQMEYNVEGKTHTQTHTCIFDRYVGRDLRDVVVGDIVFEVSLKKRHLVIGINEEYIDGNFDGYYILALKFLDYDDRYSEHE